MYIEYEAFKKGYHDAQIAYDALLTKKSAIIARKAYHRELKNINSKLADAQQLIIEREFLLSKKLEELRNSHEPCDQVYYFRYVEHMKVKRISAKVHYSDTQVYRILNTISETLALSHNGRE